MSYDMGIKRNITKKQLKDVLLKKGLGSKDR
jgi:hypothetical protein